MTGLFNSVCQLYQVGLVIEEYYPTAALAYFVAAADAASAAPDAGSSFGEFVRRFGPPHRDRAALIDRLYGEIRSSHFHAGQFALGDFKARGASFLGEPDEKLRGDFYFEGRKLMRAALLAWAESLANVDADS